MTGYFSYKEITAVSTVSQVMKKLLYPENNKLPYIIIIITYSMYVLVFSAYYERLGIGSAALAIFPVVAAGWYFGSAGAR